MLSLFKKKGGNYYYVALVGLSTLISGTINYLYHPIMIRYLDITEFGMMQGLLSLFTLMSILAGGLSLYATQQLSLHKEDRSFTYVFIREGLYYLGISSAILLLIVLLFSKFIMQYLHLPNIRPVIIVGISILFSMLSVVYSSFLQANHEFEYISIGNILGSLLRVIPGYLTLLVGRGIYGSIGAVSLGSLCLLLYLYRIYSRHHADIVVSPNQYTIYKKSIVSDFLQERKSVVMFCIVGGGVLLLLNADIVIVQHLFVGEQAGNYAAVSVLSKFLLFLGTALESVYYPQLAKKDIADVAMIQLRNYLVLIVLLIFGSLLGTYLFGKEVLFLYKSHLVDYYGLLLRLLMISGGLFICSSFVKLFVARRKQYWVIGLLLIGTIGIYTLNMTSSLSSFIYYYSILIALLCCYVFISLAYFIRGK